MAYGKFATAINCMDGRVQEPVISWFKIRQGYDYVDMITEPGPIKSLADGDPKVIESIKMRTAISVEKHHSDIIAVVGHYDCAGNPESKEVQLAQIDYSIQEVKSWGFNVKVVGLWVGDRWSAELVRE
jgi:hypothetical protein